jgi:hypothetical protein
MWFFQKFLNSDIIAQAVNLTTLIFLAGANLVELECRLNSF